MPTVHFFVNMEQTQEEKRHLAQRLTKAVNDATQTKPEHVTLYLHHHTGGAQDMASAGQLVSEQSDS